MKKFFIIMAILAVASISAAADVTVSIVIPDQYVPLLIDTIKLEKMYPGDSLCNDLDQTKLTDVRKCYIRWVLTETKKLVQDHYYPIDLKAVTDTVTKREFDATGE